jgi:OmpA-OmpF porin, OOP family
LHRHLPSRQGRFIVLLIAATTVAGVPVDTGRAYARPLATRQGQAPRTDYLTFARGALPVAIEGDAKALGVDMEQALLAIDGNEGDFALTPRPGTSDSRVAFVYRLPARTTFTEFAVPEVLETPSPAQTFVRVVEVAGSDAGPDGPFLPLASATLSTHAEKGQTTTMAATAAVPVRWVRVSLRGGIDVQRDKTFFEFSEILGYGTQESVPQSTAFTGKWRGRGVLLELRQANARVTGCYDGVGDLRGTVSGNVLRATGTSRDGGIPSAFVLAVGERGEITGVRSTNGAPFRLYTGDTATTINTQCRELAVPPLGCGSVIHGINFDFDSAVIRPESGSLLDELSAGLKGESAAAITVIGHTSSEGTDAYNAQLSERRARSVIEAMVTRGVAPGRMSARGLGETKPIADNATEAGRSLNRRVEIACNEQ